MLRLATFIIALAFQMSAFAQSFDHSHTIYNKVLTKRVVTYDNGLKSAIDYHGLSQNRQQLDQYLTSLSDVEQTQYQQWSKDQQLVFLINAYNGFTLQLIINHIAEFESKDSESIRDLGSFFSTPWEMSFFTLLGKKRNLDWIEHEKIRVDFNEPRIHAALVCAAISCPKLRDEAFTADQLETQLEDQMVSFLSDNEKNGIDGEGLYLSKIFDWYSEDFGELKNYIQGYTEALTTKSDNHPSLLNDEISIRYIDYNWQLNSLENR